MKNIIIDLVAVIMMVVGVMIVEIDPAIGLVLAISGGVIVYNVTIDKIWNWANK